MSSSSSGFGTVKSYSSVSESEASSSSEDTVSCAYCDPGTAPRKIYVTFSGMWGFGIGEDVSEYLNTTEFELTFVGNEATCMWDFTDEQFGIVGGYPGGTLYFRVTLANLGGGQYGWLLATTPTNCGPTCFVGYYTKTLVGNPPYDCETSLAGSYAHSYGSLYTECVYSAGAQAHITL